MGETRNKADEDDGWKMEGEFMGKKSHSFQVDRLTLSAADPGVGLVTGPYGAYHYG